MQLEVCKKCAGLNLALWPQRGGDSPTLQVLLCYSGLPTPEVLTFPASAAEAHVPHIPPRKRKRVIDHLWHDGEEQVTSIWMSVSPWQLSFNALAGVFKVASETLGSQCLIGFPFLSAWPYFITVVLSAKVHQNKKMWIRKSLPPPPSLIIGLEILSSCQATVQKTFSFLQSE